MRRSSFLLTAVSLAAFLLMPGVGWAQCSAVFNATLDEDLQVFIAAVHTTNPHCPASGTITLSSVPPGSVVFGSGHQPMMISSFFDIFTEISCVTPPVIGTMPGMPVQIIAQIDFSDPEIYPSQVTTVNVIGTSPSHLQLVQQFACNGAVTPPFMLPMTASCFKVCNKTYHVNLGASATQGKPIIKVQPGCNYDTPCDWDACVPGDTNFYVAAVNQRGGIWWLDFSYCQATNFPRCFCVTYVGNLPMNYNVTGLIALNRERQTLDLTVTPGGSFSACGAMEVFSFPSGANIQMAGGGSGGAFQFNGPVGQTMVMTASRGSFMPGDTFKLVAYLDYGPTICPDYSSQWFTELVTVQPDGGLLLLDAGHECLSGGGAQVPAELTMGVPQCLIVCHDIYYIPLRFTGVGEPTVSVVSGCGMMTPCMSPLPCNPGGLTDYVATVFRVGGTWILRFEYSNPNNEPACYCVQMTTVQTVPFVANVLTALDEATQMLNVTVSSDPDHPVSGQITVDRQPIGGGGGSQVQSFFDIGEPVTLYFPIPPEAAPGQTYELVVTPQYFDPGSDPFDGAVCVESVIGLPSGQLAVWDPVDPCIANVPPVMSPLQSACFTVCHDLYDIVMLAPPGSGQPIISVIPGCNGGTNPCASPTTCTPGGPADYVYHFYYDGIQWHLVFEYSNEFVEPVCYCVTYTGNMPSATTHELAGLDETNQTLNVSVAVEGPAGSAADGFIHVGSNPPGASFGPFIDSFFDVFLEWYTVPILVNPGTFLPGQSFQLVIHVDYTTPDYPDAFLTEDVTVDPSGLLIVRDAGGECASGVEFVPASMGPGDAACFHVCHRIYHIPISWPFPGRPPISISSGCYGPGIDQCAPDPRCTPGGIWDYRWTLNPGPLAWDLEFEYSNPNIEPVCYCVSVGLPPCDPVTDLVIYYDYSELTVPLLKLCWTAPQEGWFDIYSTVNPNNYGDPPGLGWVLEDSPYLPAGATIWTQAGVPGPIYRNYVVKHRCTPAGGTR